MKRKQLTISGRTCYLYHDAEATHLLIQSVDEHDLELLDQEVEVIRNQRKTPFSLVALLIEDWNQELTPWAAPAVFGRIPFGDGANNTLKFITEQLLPSLAADGIYSAGMRLLLGGYSLAGLFALWTAYQTDVFDGIAAASPSVWFTKWIDYATEKRPLSKSVYLSLGDKEERVKNPVMAQVGNAIRKQQELLLEQEVNTILEWNAGNHFVDSEKRMANGFAWLLNNQK
ncbi:MAG: esterase [Bacteroidales bacterium]|nr:esterase [Bacteroidales bacterium]